VWESLPATAEGPPLPQKGLASEAQYKILIVRLPPV